MGKTITVRIDDTTYERIKSAADSERRTISNFLEYAALTYVENASFVTDEEMREITEDNELIDGIKKSLDDIKKGKYHIVE